MKINELLKNIVKELKDYPMLKSIVLYGSYARGEEKRGSDIDLFIVIDTPKPVNELGKILKLIRKVDKDSLVNVQLSNLKEDNYSLFREILREGIMLYGKIDFGVKNLKLDAYRVINYGLKDLKPSVKVKISKRVNGTVVKKKYKGVIKTYNYEGLRQDKGVIVLPQSTVMLPEESSRGFINFLELNNVKFSQYKIWKES